MAANIEKRSADALLTPYNLTAAPLQAITICSAAAAVLNGEVKTPVPDSFLWQINRGGSWVSAPSGNTLKDYITSSLTNTGTTSIVFSLRRQTITGGVVAYDSFYDVTVRPISAVTNNTITAPAVVQFCNTGNPAAITGSTATGGDGTYAYQWQSSTDNITFTDITGAVSKNYDPPVLSTDTYYRRIVTSGACTTPATSNVVIFRVSPPPQPPPPLTTALSTCYGTPILISLASPAGAAKYFWYDSPAKNLLVATGPTYVTPALYANTSYYVEASNGTCGSQLTKVTVTVVPLPDVPRFTQSTVSACTGSTTTLSIQNAQSGVVYNWYSSATDNNILHTGTSYTLSNVTSSTSFYVQAVNGTLGCNSAARGTVSLSVVNLPTVTVSSGNVSVCPGTSATLSASSTDAAAVISWYDAPTGGNLLAKGATYTTGNLTSAKNYYVEASNTTGCNSNGRTVVQVQMTKPLDAPIVTVAETTSSGVTFSWGAVTGATGYQVSTDNGLTYTAPSSGNNGLTHTVSGLDVNQPVTITVKALGATSCTLSEASAAVTATTIDNNNIIYVANNFTPNGDGNNDIIYVHGKNINTLSFYVYDQWGQLVFTSTDVNKGWDGYFKGSLMPVGVYVYYLKATMNNGAQLNKKGTITLLR